MRLGGRRQAPGGRGKNSKQRDEEDGRDEKDERDERDGKDGEEKAGYRGKNAIQQDSISRQVRGGAFFAHRFSLVYLANAPFSLSITNWLNIKGNVPKQTSLIVLRHIWMPTSCASSNQLGPNA